MNKILLVEDDGLLGKATKSFLQKEGFVVRWVVQVKDAAAFLAAEPFDVVLLDLILPDGNGLTLLKMLRQEGQTLPVLILTARDAVSQRIEGLDSGADDYVVKPYDLYELVARIKAMVRRSKQRPSDTILYKNIKIDPLSQEVLCGGQHVDLSPKEYALLVYFLEHQGQVLSKATLEDYLYTWSGDIESNAIEVYVHHLRKKCGADVIKTLRGFGYKVDKE